MINCLNWLGLCENYSTIYTMRNWLAAVDELVVRKQASWGVTHIIFDNMDIKINQLHHLTLPVLMFELFPTFHLPNNDEKSFQDTLNLFALDILDMDSVTNQTDKDHFLMAVLFNIRG